MTNRRTIFLLLFGIALVILVLMVLSRHTDILRRPVRPTSGLLEHRVDTAERLAFCSGEHRLELRKDTEGNWSLYTPFQARVNPERVFRLLDILEQAPVLDSIPFPELRRRKLTPETFGITNGAPEIVLGGRDWSDHLTIGFPSPSGHEVYLRVNHDETILAIPIALRSALPTSLDAWRDRELIRSDRASLCFIEIRRPNQPFIRLSHATGTWEILQPAPAPADDRKVERLLDTLYGTTIDQFVWPTPTHLGDLDELTSTLKTKLALYGFESDSRVQISLQDSEQSPAVKIEIGSPADHAHDYVLLNGAAEVGTVPSTLATAFRCTPEYLRDDRLFFLRPSAISRFEIACGDTTLVLTQTQNTWSVRSPISGPADSRAVAAVLDQLLRLRAHALFASPAASTGESPQPAVCRVDLVTASGTRRFTLAPSGEDSSAYRLQFGNDVTAYQVATADLPSEILSASGLFKLCDKSILSVSSGTIRRISRIDKTGEIILARTTPDTPWRPQNEQLQALRLREPALKTFLATLGDLRAEWIVELNVKTETLDPFGLKNPWLEITLDLESTDAVRKTLAIGKEFGFGKRYAMLRGRETLYVIDEKTVASLAAPLAEPDSQE